MFQLNLLLALIWLALTGQFTPINFFFGFALNYALLYALWRHTGEAGQPSMRYFVRMRRLIGLVLFFAKEVVAANLRVMLQVLRPTLSARPGIVAIPLESRSRVSTMLLANMLTLTPGTLSLEVSPDQRVLYVHAIDVDDVEKFRTRIKDTFERRLLELLE